MKTTTTTMLLLAFGAAAHAQTCQPLWDPTIGQPGIGSGYVGPMAVWDDGSGEKLYAGGSFTSIGGNPYGYLAAWDRVTGSWSNVGRGLSTSFVAAIMPYDPGNGEQLVVSGAFDSAGNTPRTKSIAMWNGSRWSNLGADLRTNTADPVWSMAEWNGTLYVGGKFPEIGGVVTESIASWDGSQWSALGSGVFGAFNPYVAAMIVFDDGSGPALYASGRFDGIGVPSPQIARWDGSNWSRVGGGLTPTSPIHPVEAMTIFDDGSGPALYVAGHAFSTVSGGPYNVAKWDGQSWTGVGQQIGAGRLSSIAVFDDGTGPALYVGGVNMPSVNDIARYENGVWVTLDGGVDNWVFGLRVWDDAMYVGGNFTEAGLGRLASGIVTRTSCLQGCYPDCDPNGILDIFDFLCFQNSFVLGEPYACDCDPNPACDIFDFLCFQNAFVGGCP